MSYILASLGLWVGLALLFAITVAGSWIVWSIGPYRRFKEATHNLENADVAKVIGHEFDPPIKLRAVGRRRLSEVFSPQLSGDTQLVTCFGAIFLKEEAIEESLTHLRLCCGIALAVMVIGGLVMIVADPGKQAELASAGLWEVTPQMFKTVLSAHLFLVTEIAVAAFLILSLLTSMKLILKLEKALK